KTDTASAARLIRKALEIEDAACSVRKQWDLTHKRLLPVLLLVLPLLFFLLLLLVVVRVLVIFGGVFFGFQFDWLYTRDLQRSPALIARQNIAFVEFFFFHIYGSVTFRAADHIVPCLLDKTVQNQKLGAVQPRLRTPEWI